MWEVLVLCGDDVSPEERKRGLWPPEATQLGTNHFLPSASSPAQPGGRRRASGQALKVGVWASWAGAGCSPGQVVGLCVSQFPLPKERPSQSALALSEGGPEQLQSCPQHAGPQACAPLGAGLHSALPRGQESSGGSSCPKSRSRAHAERPSGPRHHPSPAPAAHAQSALSSGVSEGPRPVFPSTRGTPQHLPAPGSRGQAEHPVTGSPAPPSRRVQEPVHWVRCALQPPHCRAHRAICTARTNTVASGVPTAIRDPPLAHEPLPVAWPLPSSGGPWEALVGWGLPLRSATIHGPVCQYLNCRLQRNLPEPPPCGKA